MHGGPWGAFKDPGGGVGGGLLRTPKVIIIVPNPFHISSIQVPNHCEWGAVTFEPIKSILMFFGIRNVLKICDVVNFVIQSKIFYIFRDICTTRFYY